jgi:hypothetical protein
MITRRHFLTASARLAAGGTVTLLLRPLGCGSSADNGTGASISPALPTCDGILDTSTLVQGHTHTLCTLATDLTSPPSGGVVYTTSFDDSHDHTVSLTQAQLQSINAGGTVVVTSSVAPTGHTHDFTIAKSALTMSTPAPAPTATGRY